MAYLQFTTLVIHYYILCCWANYILIFIFFLKARAWISKAICRGICFCVERFEVRGDCCLLIFFFNNAKFS